MKNICFKIAFIISPFLLVGLLFTQQVKAEPYGWSPNTDNSWQGPPKCGDSKPGSPILYQPNHPVLPQPKLNGQVRLQWTKVSEASGYNIYYGLSPNNYIYTVTDLPGEAETYTVSLLASKTYYFAVQAKKGCAAGPLSNAWAARPKGAGNYVGSATAYIPVRRTASTTVLGSTTKVVPTQTQLSTVPPVSPEVRGASTVVQPTVKFQPPVVATRPPVKAIPTPIPKPKGFLQSILSLFFGK